MANNQFICSLIAIAFLIGFVHSESCITCSSRTDINCATNASYSSIQECPSSASLGCYVRIIDGHTVRGCLSDLSELLRSNCSSDTFTSCQRCFGISDRPTCNDYVFPTHRLQCFQCDGSLDSPCGNQMELNSRVCPVFQEGDRCFIWRSSKRIERGCTSTSLDLCKSPDNCLICDGHGCNYHDQKDGNIPQASDSGVMIGASLLLPIAMVILSRM